MVPLLRLNYQVVLRSLTQPVPTPSDDGQCQEQVQRLLRSAEANRDLPHFSERSYSHALIGGFWLDKEDGSLAFAPLRLAASQVDVLQAHLEELSQRRMEDQQDNIVIVVAEARCEALHSSKGLFAVEASSPC